MDKVSRSILAGITLLVLGAVWLPLKLDAANSSRTVTLLVRVQAAAAMSVIPILSDSSLAANSPQVRLELTVRLNRGATASVWLYPAITAGDVGLAASPPADVPKLVLQITQSGRYSITVGSDLLPSAVSGTRFELQSSDGVLRVSKTL